MATSSNLPECYGKEWDPTDATMCQQCSVQPQCSRIFATERLDAIALELGQAVQAVPEELFATKAGTSVEAIRRARVMRFQPSSAPANGNSALPVVSAPPAVVHGPGVQEQKAKAPSTPAASPVVPLPSVGGPPSSEPAPAAKAKRGRKPKQSPSAAEATPPAEDSSPELVGFVINLTTGEMEHASWAKFPPLFWHGAGQAPIYQITYWSQPLDKWVWLVAEPTGRPVPAGAVELTWRQLLDAGFQQKLGADPAASIRQLSPVAQSAGASAAQ